MSAADDGSIDDSWSLLRRVHPSQVVRDEMPAPAGCPQVHSGIWRCRSTPRKSGRRMAATGVPPLKDMKATPSCDLVQACRGPLGYRWCTPRYLRTRRTPKCMARRQGVPATSSLPRRNGCTSFRLVPMAASKQEQRFVCDSRSVVGITRAISSHGDLATPNT